MNNKNKVSNKNKYKINNKSKISKKINNKINNKNKMYNKNNEMVNNNLTFQFLQPFQLNKSNPLQMKHNHYHQLINQIDLH